MKVRIGFVSNSSTSSFILGIATVKDRKTAESRFGKMDGVSIDNVSDIEFGRDVYAVYRASNEKVAFGGDELVAAYALNDDVVLTVFCEVGDSDVVESTLDKKFLQIYNSIQHGGSGLNKGMVKIIIENS